ncbi:MAG: 5-formyltetrahydrofolate cyclo-ligase [Thermodesulfobacteriota bacterium]
MLHRKEEIRKHCLKERLKLSSDEVLEKGIDIQNRFLELKEFRLSDSLALYAGFKNEVMTDNIFRSSLEQGKRVFYPRVFIDRRRLAFYEVSEKEELSVGPYDIPEPTRKRSAPVSSFDLIVVPGVAFDIHGNRLGYGKGYYDKTLSAVDGDISVIGLAYEFQVLLEVPAFSHDIKVNKIVTEDRVIEV